MRRLRRDDRSRPTLSTRTPACEGDMRRSKPLAVLFTALSTAALIVAALSSAGCCAAVASTSATAALSATKTRGVLMRSMHRAEVQPMCLARNGWARAPPFTSREDLMSNEDDEVRALWNRIADDW